MAPPSYRITNMSKVDLELIWCLKQVKGFILKFPINESFCWCIQNYMRYIQYFMHAFYSVSNIYRHFGNHEWICPMCIHTHLINKWWWKHTLKVMIRTKRKKELLYVDHYGGISILTRLFVNWSIRIYSKYKLFDLQ